MGAAVGHRGSSGPQVYRFNNGFLGCVPHTAGPPDRSMENSGRSLVIDGYVDSNHNPSHDNPSCFSIDTDLAGLFAIAAFDPSGGVLDLYRDPSGARPLYYACDAGRCIFASSPKAILSADGFSRELNPAGVSLYLSMICPPDPVTIYQSIHMLRPGFHLQWHNGRVDIARFRSLPNHSDNRAQEDIARDLRTALESAVLDAVPPDHRNTGFFLSGGTDTGAVVSLAAKAGISPINTFTIGYGGSGPGYEAYNEFYYAKLIAEHYGTIHHEFTISPDTVKQALPGIVAFLDQPSGDAINTYLVAGTLPGHIHTVLTGTGGDEIFIGSHWFKQHERLQQIAKKWNAVPSFLRHLISCSASLAGKRFSHRIDRLESLNNGVPAQYRHFKLLFSGISLENLLHPDFRRAITPDYSPERIIELYDAPEMTDDPINRLENLLFHHEVSNLQLRDVDSMSHAHGFEARSPLVDRRVLDVLHPVPGHVKAPDGKLRHLMFQALDDCLLKETRTRRKMSFIVPMDLWARRELRPVIERLLSQEVVTNRGILNPEMVRQELEAFYSKGSERHPFKIWNMAMLELWCRFHLDAPLDASPPVTLDDLL
jgi:asparagine synthase (glutamine-hydrolysing)